MNDYISRDAAKKKMLELLADDIAAYGAVIPECFPAEIANEALDAIPAADVRPVVRGRWTDHRSIEHYGEWYCTACGKEITIYMGEDRTDRYNFCPNCGAEMREET